MFKLLWMELQRTEVKVLLEQSVLHFKLKDQSMDDLLLVEKEKF